ncbi:DNA polymerase nu [Plectropomus leopardus]|uniref:DNA polymerase nu n=1 Tax=Plectropomus leopardus TaxID=160734 RepID=UPI001C4C9E46|nr:DNA polymerase nu [Plectropomus leopardus]
MEQCSSRLYSGPLSLEAQKILAVLRAQSLHAARRSNNYSYNHRQSQSGHKHRKSHLSFSQHIIYIYFKKFRPWFRPQVSSSSTSYHDASNQPQSSQTLACYQHSQTSACSLSSEASSGFSSCWDSSLQRHTSHTEAYYRCSQMYSHRKYSEPPARLSGQAPSFTQHEGTAASFFQRDRYTLSLQTPKRLCEHQVWRNSTEEIRPLFIHNFYPDNKDPDKVLFPTTEHPNTHEAEPAVACCRDSSCPKISEEPDKDTSDAQEEKGAESLHISGGKLDHMLTSDSQEKWKLPLSSFSAEVIGKNGGILYHQSEEKVQQLVDSDNMMQAGAAQMSDRGHEMQDGVTFNKTRHPHAPLTNEKGSANEMEGLLLLGTNDNFSSKGILNFDNMDTSFHCYSEDTKSEQEEENVNTAEIKEVEHPPGIVNKEIPVGCHTGSPMPISLSLQIEEHEVSHCQSENTQEMSHTMSETAEKQHTENSLMWREPTKLVLGNTCADNLEKTTERRLDVTEVVLEVQRESCEGVDTSTEEKMETEQQLCSDVQTRERQCGTDYREVNELPGGDTETAERAEDRHELVMPPVDGQNGSMFAEDSGRESRSTPILSQERRAKRSRFRAPGLRGNHQHHDNSQTSATDRPLKNKQARCGPEQSTNELKMCIEEVNDNKQSKAGCLTASLTSDPRVKDSGKMNQHEKMRMLEMAGKTKALMLTLVYRDGTTQLDPEQKLTPAVCGLLVLMKNNLDHSTPEDSFGPNDSLVYLKLEHTPAWAQQHTHQSQELFTRDMLLQVLSRTQLVVCYKAKDFLRTALQFYRGDLSWKQVARCHIQDPQVSGWLLDPANPSSCYQDLLNKHCKRPHTVPALGTKKVSQVISGLCSLYWLNMELCFKLQSRGLWMLYSDMELKMISVLAVMESHRIHVDKEALKRTSDLLGAKMKQLEQEAHRAAGQIFLVTSNSQLRTVLFEKLSLHERCENKKLPKTINKQQSTSEAALLQLQDLHPLPKIILEYRQVHKIKSTFVDGILSCMMRKSYVSSSWHQTSVVTGRISAKHPNFQALPRQPLQITKMQHIQGKEEEVVTVHPRAMFIPQEGWTFLAADFCQVELRLLAHLSSDLSCSAFSSTRRLTSFTMLASQWKGVSESEVTPEDREHAKRIVYSVVYGAGRERLSGILGVSAEQASRFQDSFLQTYREVQSFIQRTIQQCHKQGYVLSIMGRRRTLPHISSPDWGIRMQAERQAVNFVVQGSAADLCKMAMIRIFNLVASSSLSARLVAQLHDELLYEVEDSQVEQFAALVRSTMESLQHIDHLGVHLKVPLKVAVSSGKSWGSMSELNISPVSPL